MLSVGERCQAVPIYIKEGDTVMGKAAGAMRSGGLVFFSPAGPRGSRGFV